MSRQDLGEPRPARGGRFRPEWFRRYTEDGQLFYLHKPSGKEVRLKRWSWTFCTVGAVEKETSDYTAIAVFTVTDTRELLIREVICEQLPVDGIAPRLWSVCQTWRPQYVWVEGERAFMSIVEQADRTPGLPTIKLLEPLNESMLVRATPAINRAHGGQIYLPEQAPWLDEFIPELLQFTGDEELGAHWAMIEALVCGVICLDQVGTRPSGAVDTQDPSPTPKDWKELWEFNLRPSGGTYRSNQAGRGLYGLGRNGHWGHADERGLFGRGRRPW
jgi:phage terminase large subunit-like protein